MLQRAAGGTGRFVHPCRTSFVLAVLLATACARSPRTAPMTPPAVDARIARVSLGNVAVATVSATGPFRLLDDGGRVIMEADSGARVSVSVSGNAFSVLDRGTNLDVGTARPIRVVAAGRGLATLNNRRYRGDLLLLPADSMVHVVNRVVI